MEELPRSDTPIASQAIDPGLLQQVLIALAQLQVQNQVPPPRISREPNPPDVPKFNGRKSQYTQFLGLVQNFFNLQPVTYDSDSKKIGYVISRLEGTAADWAVTILENQSLGNNYEILNVWNTFLQSFSKFSDPFLKRNATDALLSLSQKNSESVLSYWTKFEELLYRSDISPDSARPLFERGLKYEIRDRLVDKDLPDSLDGYVTAVVDLDNRLYRLRNDKQNNGGSRRYSSQVFTRQDCYPETQKSFSQTQKGPTPMEIGKLEVEEEAMINGMLLSNSKERLDEIRRMEPVKRRRVCMEENRCHYCKVVVGFPPTHVAQNCPVKSNKAKSDYLTVFPEAFPQKGILDESSTKGIPQRQEICLNFVNDRETMLSSLDINLLLKPGRLVVGDQTVRVELMIDSGAMGMGYIDRTFVRSHGLRINKLNKKISVKTIDGTPCGSGAIECCVLGNISFDDFCEDMELMVIDSPRHPIILGFEWLCRYNPVINWNSGEVLFDNAKSPEGIPTCTSEGIPLRQVSDSSQKFKRVSFADSVSVRVVSNYIKRTKETCGMLSFLPNVLTDLPRNTAEFQSTHVDPLEDTYVPVVLPPLVSDAPPLMNINAVFEAAEKEESIMIGFVDQYTVVEEIGKEGEDSEGILKEFEDVFSQEEFPDLPIHRHGVDLSIDLVEGKTAPFGPIYSLSVQEEHVLKKYLDGALAAGIIRKSTSSAGAPVMFVKKSDGSLRLCVDYRGLNSVTKTNRAALPIIRDLIFRANGSKYFSKIDLKSAFNLIRIQEGQEFLTAFRTKYGHYEYLVMPFGLKNAPSTFQALMNSVFGDLIDRGILVYIDDILIYTQDLDSHEKLLREVFERLRRNKLKANPKKCSLYQLQVEFLGHVISAKGVQMDANKVKSIQDWAPPSNVKELQSFLGLCNYYRDFIPGFANIACSLYHLTKKDSPYSWNQESQRAFDAIKNEFLTDRILILPDVTKRFYLECDASDYALGVVLSQKNDKGALQPIGFYSRKFSAAEINYEIYDKELLAIIEGFKNWRHYCIGTDQPVVVYTDHNNLRYFMTSRNLNRRQARWSLFLADYNFEITVRPGSQQIVSDALSRQESMQIAPQDDEFKVNQQVLLPRNLFPCIEDCYLKKGAPNDTQVAGAPQRQDVTHLSVLVSDEDSESLSSDEDDTSATDSDFDTTVYHSDNGAGSDSESSDGTSVGDLAQFMEFEGQTESEDPAWFQYLLQYLWFGHLPMVLPFSTLQKIKTLSKSFLFKNDRLFKKIVRNGQLYHVPYVPYVDREALIGKYHTTLGHMQLNTLLPLMEIRYYWPSLSNDISKFQGVCPQCQLNGSVTELNNNNRPLQPHEPVGMPFAKWGIDYVQDLPQVDGFCNIFSARDYATKTVIYVATKDRTARTAAECIFRYIVCKYGSPLELVSDRGFMDSVLAEYMKVLEIHHLPTSAYTPRSNGLDERGHQDLKNIITKLSDGDPTKWVKMLPLAEFVMNSRISNSTGFSAHYLSHGVEPRLPGDEIPMVPPGFYDLNDLGDVATLTERELARLGQNRAAALQRLKSQAVRMKLYYDTKVGAIASKFKLGDVVKMVNHTRTRFKFRFMGPFYIVDVGPNDTYFLMRPDGRRWTSANGTDTPVNPDDLVLFREHDAEYYYSGN